MADFIIRIELQDGTVSDYQKLDFMMKTDGFARKITQNGVTYHLPSAEYYIETAHNADEVLTSAMINAGTTECVFSILVTEAIAIRSYNLEGNGSGTRDTVI